jgi:hypothetical protein
MRPIAPLASPWGTSGFLASAALFFSAALCTTSSLATAQFHAQASAPAPYFAQAGRTPASARVGAPLPKPSAKRAATKPLWSELTPAQQQSLAPLAATWDTVSETQKRKWLALSQNFPMMSGAEQSKLHSRMTEWVALSPQQRTQARLNFGETKQLSPDDKKAKWEAYQALSPEEKRKLAATAPKPPATAAAVRPAPQKLTAVPTGKQTPQSKPARIAVAPDQVDVNTLLPQQVPPLQPLN